MRLAVSGGILALGLLSCAAGDVNESAPQRSEPPPQSLGPREGTGVGRGGQVPRPAEGTSADWRIARERVEWARQAGLDATADFGEVLGAIGEQFIGTAYEPHTLELPGPENLVINLEVLDCVTFVENVLTLARLVRGAAPDLLADSAGFQAAFRDELTRIRYRGSLVDGYASRLHYFSEWMTANDEKGVVDDLTGALGGVEDPMPIDFMSTHPGAYTQLADPNVLAEIVQVEAHLGRTERFYIPERDIGTKAHLIRTGDVIAATSTVPGLDVAHTGIALWRDGELRLLHAPLVGSAVQLSEEPLADRILRIEGQDGIMVARPIDPGAR